MPGLHLSFGGSFPFRSRGEKKSNGSKEKRRSSSQPAAPRSERPTTLSKSDGRKLQKSRKTANEAAEHHDYDSSPFFRGDAVQDSAEQSQTTDADLVGSFDGPIPGRKSGKLPLSLS